MRLIDADLLTNCIRKSLDKEILKGTIREKGFEVYALTKFIEIVDAVPTEEPVKHGKWLNAVETHPELYGWCRLNEVVCSQCDDIHKHKSNYCPNCGARMDGE